MSATIKVDIRAIAAWRRPGAAGLSERRCRRPRSAGRGARRHAADPAARKIRDGADRAHRSRCRAGYEAQVRPRSGLAAKHGVTVLNSPGTVDADYRGEISVLLINHGEAPFPIRRGERIAQMVIAPVVQARTRCRRRRCRRPTAAAAASARPGADARESRIRLHIKSRAIVTHFPVPDFAFTVWTLTARTPEEDIVASIRATARPVRAGRWMFVRSWGKSCRA